MCYSKCVHQLHTHQRGIWRADLDSMYYHTSIMHLFRPFLWVDLTNSDVSPREVCKTCASTIHYMISNYRRIYGFQQGLLILSHVIMSANIIDLVNMPNPSAVEHLILGVTCLREMSYHQILGSRFLDIILALAEQWKKPLPAGIYQAAQRSSPRPESSKNHNSNKLNYQTSMPELNHHQVSESYELEQPLNDSTLYNGKDGSRTQNGGVDYLWSPFPNQSVPLRGTQPTGPMDISNVIDDQYNNQWVLNRDGFKIAGISDPNAWSNEYNLGSSWR